MTPAVKTAVTAALLATATTIATPASAAVLDFSGPVCQFDQGQCIDGFRLSQGYGDITGQLDVIQDDILGDAVDAGTADAALRWWGTGYSGLSGIAYGGVNDVTGTAELFFSPAAGYRVTVTGFDLGSFVSIGESTSYTVRDGSGDILFSSGPLVVGAAGLAVTGNWSSLEGIRLQLGPSVYNVGIDNIQVQVEAVPLPATAWLLATAVLGAGWRTARRWSLPA